MQLTIKGKDKSLLRRVEDLARQLGLQVVKNDDHPAFKTKTANAMKALKELRDMNAFKDIHDPVEWQREQRTDRDIGRNE